METPLPLVARTSPMSTRMLMRVMLLSMPITWIWIPLMTKMMMRMIHHNWAGVLVAVTMADSDTCVSTRTVHGSTSAITYQHKFFMTKCP